VGAAPFEYMQAPDPPPLAPGEPLRAGWRRIEERRTPLGLARRTRW
jgi:hypothetical protein